MNEKERYCVKILAEELYSNLKLVSEGTAETEDEKRKTAAQLIHFFYMKYKDVYHINSLQEVEEVLEEIKPKKKEGHEER